jgi:hypothetical protein
MPEPPESERLREEYRSRADEELLKLAGQGEELTETAREALRAELARRGIEAAVPEPPPAQPEGFTIDPEDSIVAIQSFQDLPRALLAKSLLDSAEIQCFLVDDNTVRMDWFLANALGGIRLAVRREDADAALDLLESEPPPEFTYDPAVPAFEQPICPHCGSRNIRFPGVAQESLVLAYAIGIPIPIRAHSGHCEDCNATWRADDEKPSGEATQS